ncbi:MAG: hypothetical protein MR316_01700, partial [Lachnospiraceae bacterium]|nr:hypothetical protein [Lachnospiraceae bacterium]
DQITVRFIIRNFRQRPERFITPLGNACKNGYIYGIMDISVIFLEVSEVLQKCSISKGEKET